MFHTPAHKNTASPGAIVMPPPVAEFRVLLHTANGDVVTTYRSLDGALALVREYAENGKRASIERSFA